MSSSEEIQEVFEQEIAEKTRVIGAHKLLDSLNGFQIEEFPDHIISETDRDLLRRIYDKDADWRKEDSGYLRIAEEDKRRLGEIILQIAGEEDVVS